ncbi:hypothetical protein M2R47_00240 [Moraxella sp. Tifton1]|nr:hypothetical protein [Moraxella sp. Tifton1]MCL1622685.1 hypothetical protein [Moraxella sp. Tifton1]
MNKTSPSINSAPLPNTAVVITPPLINTASIFCNRHSQNTIKFHQYQLNY